MEQSSPYQFGLQYTLTSKSSLQVEDDHGMTHRYLCHHDDVRDNSESIVQGQISGIFVTMVMLETIQRAFYRVRNQIYLLP